MGTCPPCWARAHHVSVGVSHGIRADLKFFLVGEEGVGGKGRTGNKPADALYIVTVLHIHDIVFGNEIDMRMKLNIILKYN